MIRLNKEISKLSSYIVLLVYLTIIVANIFHHHNIDLGQSFSVFTDLDIKNNSHHNSNRLEFFCLVQFAYQSISNSLITIDDQFNTEYDKPDIVDLNSFSHKPIRETILFFSLRAPPISYS